MFLSPSLNPLIVVTKNTDIKFLFNVDRQPRVTGNPHLYRFPVVHCEESEMRESIMELLLKK